MKYLECRRQNRINTAGRIYKRSEDKNKVVGTVLPTTLEKTVKTENKAFRREYVI